MADDNTQQLVYEVKVSLGDSVREMEALKKNFGDTSQIVRTLNDMTVKVVPDGETTHELQSLQQKLQEIRKAIEMFSRGGDVQFKINGIDMAIDDMRKLEKTYEDMQKTIKSGSTNSQIKENERIAIKELTQALNMQKKAQDDLNRSMAEGGKLMSQSTYYRNRNKWDDANNTLGDYNQNKRDNPYGNMSYGQYGAARQAMEQARQQDVREQAEEEQRIKQNSAMHKQAWNDITKAVNGYETACNKAVISLNDGSQKSEASWNRMMSTVSSAEEKMKSFGASSQVANPFDNLTREQHNMEVAVGNCQRYALGIRSYASEINRLRAVQESMFQVWSMDKTPEHAAALVTARNNVVALTKEYEHYQHVIGNSAITTDSFMGKMRSHLYWILAGGSLATMFAIPAETLSTIVKVDEAMHNLGTVMPSLEASEKAVVTEQSKLISTAGEYGAVVSDVIESARLWGRMYKDVDTVNVLTSQSSKLAVADNFSLAESTKAVEAAMFQYGLTAKNSAEALAYSNKIVDTYTALSHQAGVSAQNLAAGVERSGAAASQAGVDFEFLTALIAQGTRATALGGANIGDMLKTLFASIHSKKAVDELNKLGIAVETVGDDGVKHFRRTQDVLIDVAIAAQGTNNNLQQLFQQMSGGKFQWSKAAAMLSSYDEIVKNWGIAVNSMGFTDNQVRTQMDSISRRLQTLKADLVGLAEQGATGGLTAVIKDAIKTTDNLIKMLDRVPASVYGNIGTFVKWGLELFVLVKGFTTLKNKIIEMSIATGAIEAATAATVGFETAVVALGGSMKKLFNTMRILAAKSGVGLLWVAGTVVIGELIDKLDLFGDSVDKVSSKEQDEYAVKQQLVEQYNKQMDFVSSLLDAHSKITEAINDENTTEEKRISLADSLKTTEDELTEQLGNDAVEQLKQDNWKKESVESVKKEFIEATREKQRILADWMIQSLKQARTTIDTAKQQIVAYDEDAKAYINGNKSKMDSLSALAAVENTYWLFKAAMADKDASTAKARMDKALGNVNKFYDDMDNFDENDPGFKAAVAEYNKAKSDYEVADSNRRDTKNDVYYQVFGSTKDDAEKAISDAMKTLGDTTSAAMKDIDSLVKPWSGHSPGGDINTNSDSSDTSSKSGGGHAKERDLNNDILNAAKGELDLPYGGTDWRDLGEKVCTTFVQTALAQAGIDEDTVDSLTADANNWASAAGTAFHPYGTGYQTKPGDILLVNTNADGANHVAIADENANGYYAAGGNAGVSAHYNTNWESAFADEGILGVISVNEFAGVPMASKESGKVNRRSIYDFRADKYDEYQRQQELANEKYEQTKKSIDTYEKANGKDFTSALLTTQNEEDKLVSTESAAKMAQGLYNGISKRIADYISAHPEISEMLAKQGKTWDSLVPKEQSTIAELTGNSDLRKDIENREQLRKKVEELIAARDSQRVTVDALHGAMTPEALATYRNEQASRDYESNIANQGNDHSFAADHARKQAKILELTQQLAASQDNLTEKQKQYNAAVANEPVELAKMSAEIASKESAISKMTDPGEIKEANAELTRMKTAYQQAGQYGTEAMRNAAKATQEAQTQTKKLGNDLKQLNDQNLEQLKEKGADMFTDLIVEGKSFHDVMKGLLSDLAKYAIRAAFGLSNQGSWISALFGMSTGGSIDKKANGGSLEGYDTGGAIHGAGTGRSDSILAYLANKDKFVYLSNGEYVMNAEATKRVGVENLDALNGYADGGALSPTPYVASIDPTLAKKATSINGSGDTVALLKEQNKKMSEQLAVLKGMGQGDIKMVVLNTQASSADVLRALQENPRAVQALMGQQRSMGFR